MQINLAQISKCAEKTGLGTDFIKDRIEVNRRRVLVTRDILQKRGLDISKSDVLEVGSHIGIGLILTDT